MNPLLEQFVIESRDFLDSIAQGLLTLERDPRDSAAIDELFRAVHTLKGNSGLFAEYSAFTHLVHAGEDLLDVVRDGTRGFDAEVADHLLECMDIVSLMLDNIDAKYGDDISALKGASIQDVINGNTTSINQLVADQKNGTFKVEVNGTSYGAWNKPTDFTPPAGTKLASFESFDNGSASLVYDDKGRPVWVENDSKTAVKTWNPTTGEYTLPTVVVTAKAPTEQERILALAELGEEDVVQGTVSRAVLNAAQTLVGWAQKSGNSTLINTTANIMKAGGGFVESINGMSVLLGVAPSSTKMGKFANALQDIGKAGNTAEYQAAVKNMQSIIGNANGVGGTLEAIYGAFKSAPLQFLAEYVGVEGIQEVAPLLIGGVAAGGAKGAALALKYGEALAAKMGTAAGMTAAIATDIAESAGGAASSAYNETYKVAIKAGKTPAEADKIALEVAQRQAFVAGATTAVSMGIGGAALEKAVLGRTGTKLGDAMQALGDFAKTGTKITIKEGVSEAGEEGVTQAALEGQLYKLDKTRDVAKEITQAAAFGMIAGGPIAGGAYGASRAGDVISNMTQGNAVIADILETTMLERKNIHPNVDFPAAYAYYLLGIPIDLYTPIFVVARVAGYTAHAIEQLQNNRLIRPKAIYDGNANLTYIPLAERP